MVCNGAGRPGAWMSLITQEQGHGNALGGVFGRQPRHEDSERERGELRSLVEDSGDAIWSWDTDGTIRRWNARAGSLFGYTPEEIVGRSLALLVPPDRQEEVRGAIGKLVQGIPSGPFETIRLAKNGTPIAVEITVSPIIGPDGAITGAATICRDIRERRQVEAELARRMAELTTLIQLSERLQLARDLSEIYEAALDAIVESLGCTRASVLLFDAARVMRFVAWRGLSERYRRAVDGHSPWTPDTANAAPICIEDIDRSGESESLKQIIASEGIRALTFMPLVSDGRLIGKFMTYFPEARAFSEHAINLASMIARQLALAIGRKLAEQELRESETRFRLMSEHAPVMIWVSDAQGRCLHLNRMLRRFWGVSEDDIDSFDWRTTIHPDDAPEIARQVMEALAARQPVTVKGRYRDAGGTYRVLQTDARPRFSSGELLGMIGTNVDVTEREEAEQALRASEQRFRLAVEASPNAMVMTDREGRVILVNAQAEKLFGYSRDELVGQKVERLVPERFQQHHPDFRSAYSAHPSARPMGEGRDLFARRKDGSEVPVEIGLSPIETPDGMMAMAAIVDISARKRAEAQRELLVAELNHRVKNTLSIVQGIAYQTFRAGNAPPELRRALEGRLVALAGAHNLLTEANWENASLVELASVTMEARGANAARVTLSGPPLRLPPKQALSLVMALHELCTNAKKYGALSNETGCITLDWTLRGDEVPLLAMRWRESGGPPVAPPGRRGFGSVLLERMLARDLEGEVTVTFDPEGLICSISAPLPRQKDGA